MSRKRHGMSHTPIHDIWCGMNNRCNNLTNTLRGTLYYWQVDISKLKGAAR